MKDYKKQLKDMHKDCFDRILAHKNQLNLAKGKNAEKIKKELKILNDISKKLSKIIERF